MLKEIFLFELSYRKNRAANYIYFAIIFLMAFFLVASPVLTGLGAVGQVKPNSPYVIAQLTMSLTYLLTMVVSAIMGAGFSFVGMAATAL